jgi:ABC-type oligopeptide transport system substrate-binding subunit
MDDWLDSFVNVAHRVRWIVAITADALSPSNKETILNTLRHRRSIALAILVIAFALVASACSSSDDAADDTTTTAAETTETTVAPSTDTTAAGSTETTVAPDESIPTALSGLTKVDDLTFTVELNQADPEFSIQTYYGAYFPLPSVALEDPIAFEESPIGNGPLMMDGVWEHDVQIPMKTYADYAGDDPSQVDTFSFQIYADPVTAYNDVLAGNLDVVDTVPTDFLGSYQDEFPGHNGEAQDTGFTYFGFPTYRDQFTRNHMVAMSMAIDREEIMDKVFLNARDAAHSVIPPNLEGRDDVCPSWNFDPSAARALWDAAGDPGPITFWFNAGGDHELWVEAVVNMWGKNLGMDTSTVTFEVLEFSEYLPVVDAQELTGPFRLGWGMDYPSPINFLEPLYASWNAAPVGSNNAIYNNPLFDEALNAGKAALAETGLMSEALPDLYAAENILCEDGNIAPVYFTKKQFVWSDNVDGVFIDANGDLGYSSITSADGAASTFIIEPEHLFPPTSNESEGIAVNRALFRGLTQLDAETNSIVNMMAESFTSEDGGLTWTIVLKDGWTFHNGEAVTADSYINAWNYGALGSNAMQNNSHYSKIAGYDDMNPEEG